jgi:hypothetical protein
MASNIIYLSYSMQDYTNNIIVFIEKKRFYAVVLRYSLLLCISVNCRFVHKKIGENNHSLEIDRSSIDIDKKNTINNHSKSYFTILTNI